MRYNALGLVEVKGYLGAIAAADAALKAAGVNCIGLEVIKGGLVTVKLSGEVGAVQAAVEAGAVIAAQLDVLLTRHVIPRIHEETAALVVSPVDASGNTEQLVEGITDPLADDVKLPAVAATSEAGEIKPDADEGKATAETIKQATDRSKPSGRKRNKPEPEANTVVALGQAETQAASRDKATPAVKRSKNAKKASL